MNIVKLIFISICMALRMLYYVVRPLFAFYYEKHRQQIPDIDNDLLRKPALELARMIREKEITSVELVTAFIRRIRQVNGALNAVVAYRFEDALAEAEAVDKMIASGDLDEKDLMENKPFLGVPTCLKECFAVKGMSWTSGNILRKSVKAEFDAPVVVRLKSSGLIVLGVTNVSELCMWWETSNLVYGTTKNPYNTCRIVGGSSGGEACIVAAAGAVVGLGSDIGGSIRMPAFFNGIFGHKPTNGIVNNDGQMPIATKGGKDFLSTGPFCRYASDLIPMMKVMADSDKIGLLKLDEDVDVRKLRFFYMEEAEGSVTTLPVHPNVRSGLKRVVDHFSNLGAEVHRVSLPEFQDCVNLWFAGMSESGEEPFVAQLAEESKSWNLYEEIARVVLRLPRHTVPALMLAVLEKFPMPKKMAEKFQNRAKKLKSDLLKLLGKDGVFVFPTHPTPALYHNEPLLVPFNWAYTGVFNVLGLPACNIPLGLSSTSRVPIGVQIVTAPYMDRLSLAIANYLEQESIAGWTEPNK